MWLRALPLVMLVVIPWTVGCGGAKRTEPAIAQSPTASPSTLASPPPVSSVTPLPPPPPPQKCESLIEHCLGDSGKVARIANSLLVFTPPTALLYAQEEAATVVQSSDEGAVLALAGYDVTESTKVDSARAPAYEMLVRRIGVVAPKGKFDWKERPHETRQAGTFTNSVYGLKGASRAGHRGEMGLFTLSPAAGKAVVGVAFVPQEDDVTGHQLVTALDTVRLAPPPLADDPFSDPRPATLVAPSPSNKPSDAKGKP